MDDKRPQDELSEQIDAVRPASDDLSHPDFARLAERSRRDAQIRAQLQRSQRLDLAIGDALQDLSVPAGAVERLLNTLASATTAPRLRETEHAAAAGVPQDEPAQNTHPRRATARAALPTEDERPDFESCEAAVTEQRATHDAPSSADAPNDDGTARRRRSRPGMGALAAAAVMVLLGAFWLLQPGASEFGPDEALNILNSDWLFNVDEAAIAQTPIDERQPPPRYPVAQAVSIPATAWRRITDFLGRSGVAYQLHNAATRATLYVVDVEAGNDAPQVVDLPAVPSTPPFTTAGKAMSIWREGKLLYVLVVSGGEAEFKSFVTRGGQLARASSASSHVAFP